MSGDVPIKLALTFLTDLLQKLDQVASLGLRRDVELHVVSRHYGVGSGLPASLIAHLSYIDPPTMQTASRTVYSHRFGTNSLHPSFISEKESWRISSMTGCATARLELLPGRRDPPGASDRENSVNLRVINSRARAE